MVPDVWPQQFLYTCLVGVYIVYILLQVRVFVLQVTPVLYCTVLYCTVLGTVLY